MGHRHPLLYELASETVHLVPSIFRAPVYCRQLEHSLSRSIGKLAPHSGVRPQLLMTSHSARTDRRNTLLACSAVKGRSCVEPSTCKVSVQQAKPSLQSPIQLPGRQSSHQSVTTSERHQGVPVFVMLPLDTVSPYAAAAWTLPDVAL